jgi:Tol biopolymer transport system component
VSLLALCLCETDAGVKFYRLRIDPTYRLIVSVRSVGVLVAAVLVVATSAVVSGASARLPSPPIVAASPTYSRDGSQVAYAIHRIGGPRGWLVVASRKGNDAHTVYSSTDSCCGPVGWASSDRIVFVDDYQLKSVDLRSGRVRKLATGAAYFTLSPNGETIAIADGCECNHAPDAVALVGIDGHGYRLVPKPRDATDELDGFSPDGTQLVFTRYPYTYDNPATNRPSLYAVSVKGGAPVPLSRSGLIGASHLPPNADSTSWSPDGRWISFFTPKGLWMLNTATGKVRLAVSAHGNGSPLSRAAAWSPTSHELAYPGGYPFGKRTRAGQPSIARLVLVTTAGTQKQLWRNSVTYLTNEPGDLPQWSPNGKSLIFVGRPAGTFARAKVYAVASDGRALRRIG